MEISPSDIEKIKLITVSAQVNDLVTLLLNIDKESLINSIESIDDHDSKNYKFLVCAKAFYDDIEGEITRDNET